MADRGIDDRNVLRRGPGEEAAVGRVDAAAEVAFGSCEARQTLVYRCRVEDADVLGGADYKVESAIASFVTV